MIMTKKQCVVSLICAGCVLIILSFCLALYPLFPTQHPQTPISPPAANALAQSEIAAGQEIGGKTTYILKETEGYIGVYASNDLANPLYITEILVSKLRFADQALLKEGVVAENPEALSMLLEDFGS